MAPAKRRQRSLLTPFGNQLRGHLYGKEVTQERLAVAIGIAPESLSRAMRGRRNPSAELVLAISAALRLSQEEAQALLAAAGYGAREREVTLLMPTALEVQGGLGVHGLAQPALRVSKVTDQTTGERVEAIIAEARFSSEEEEQLFADHLLLVIRQVTAGWLAVKAWSRGEESGDGER